MADTGWLTLIRDDSMSASQNFGVSPFIENTLSSMDVSNDAEDSLDVSASTIGPNSSLERKY